MTDLIKNNLVLSKEWGLPEESNKNIYFRWSSAKSKIHILEDSVYTTLKFRVYNGTDVLKRRVLKILLDDILYRELEFTENTPYIDISIDVVNVKSISFETDDVFRPNLIDSKNKDYRKLGFKFYTIIADSKDTRDAIILMKDIERLITDDVHDKSLTYPILKQNKSVKMINLPYNDKNFYFNSSIFKFKGKTYLLARHAELVTYDKFINKLKLYELDDKYNVKSKVFLDIKDEVYSEQYEDPRVLVHDNKLYVSCANYQFSTYKFVHQKIMVFDDNFKHIKNIHPKYDGNGKDALSNNIHQKNWTWFIHNSKLMCVYRMCPHTVVEFDEDGNAVSEYKTFFDVNEFWNYGECRMGTNPVLKDGYYHNFFHSSIPWKFRKRQYFMGYYKFESVAPFRIVNVSTTPLLWGNESDERIAPHLNPIVVFPCGAIIKNNKFVVSFGFNDEKTGILEISTTPTLKG